MPKIRRNITLDEDINEFAERYAGENRTNVSTLVNQWFFEIMKREGDKMKAYTKRFADKIWLVDERNELKDTDGTRYPCIEVSTTGHGYEVMLLAKDSEHWIDFEEAQGHEKGFAIQEIGSREKVQELFAEAARLKDGRMYWKKEHEDGTVELHVQEGFSWGNDLTVNPIIALDGFKHEDENGKHVVHARKTGANIVEGSDTPVQMQVTVDYHSNLGVNCIFNETFETDDGISEVTEKMFSQDLGEIEGAIFRNFAGEWGTYSPLSDEEHKQRGYVRITREEAGRLAEQAGVELE